MKSLKHLLMDLIHNVIKKENVLNPEDIQSLQDYANKVAFTVPSFVYNRKKQEDVLDTQVRKSKTISVDDPEILQFVKECVLPSIEGENLVLKLARDHVTFIKYEEGGFFDWHQDHEKYIINERRKWLEMHLLICLTAPTGGGELSVEFNKDNIKQYPLKVNECIIFDKNMKHKGDIVTSGNKIIMTVDVLVSTTEVLDKTYDIDPEMAPIINIGCVSHNHNTIMKYLKFNTLPVFGMILSNGDIKQQIIYDSKGLFNIQILNNYNKDYIK
uniref:Prolyl 4-hydroxylase alpha subunit Fe(2+) 2OG dioxygenase domain-containing protein n=1 Tax=viral metagenome TaxID=1070528 RepID=A0A6C0J6R9_9ZZZZ